MSAISLDHLLVWLWQTTWQSALLALAILLVTRLLGRWLTPQAKQLLWLLVFLRLVMPGLPSSQLSAFSWVHQAETHVEPRVDINLELTTPPPPSISYFKSVPLPGPVIVQPVATVFNWSYLLVSIWLGVAVLVFGRVVINNRSFSRKLKQSNPVDQSITDLVSDCSSVLGIKHPPITLLTDIVTTPSLFGVLRPRLLLPRLSTQLDLRELRLIIFHELEHLRRHHLLADWILTAICSLHWFNPIGWRAHRQIRAARELICDRVVLAGVDDDSSRRYGLAMISLATHIRSHGRSIQLVAFAEEQNDLRQRIEAIASRRRKYIFGLGAAVVATVAVVFLTRPAPPTKLASKTSTPTTSPSKEAVDELVRVSRGLTDEHDYAHALKIIDRILELDPRNDYALNARPLVEDRALIAQQRSFRDTYDALRYPRSSPYLKAERDKTKNEDIYVKLDRKLPEIKFDAVGFSEVLDFLRDVSSANIFVNWRVLQAAGIDRVTPVTARLRDVKFSKALEIILREIGGEKVKLAYSVDEGVITISTADDLAEGVVTNVFDIRDFIVDLRPSSQPSNQTSNQPMRQTLINEIIRLIQDTVDRESWKDNGGKSGSIRELAGQLIVIQTPDNQRSIAQLIEQMRETRGLQITIESRLIELSDAKTAELLARKATRSATHPTLFLRGPATNSAQRTLHRITEWDGAQATIGILLMDEMQMPALLTGSQSAANPPRIILYNGQEFLFDAAGDATSVQLKLQASMSSDRRLATITASAAGKHRENAVKRDPVTFGVPDGASCLVRIPLEAQQDSGNLWLVLKPTLIYQREAEQQQFPIINGRQ